ncbi:MAG: hypothetical protein GX589_06610 [Deltaproteobacteria bacterium]|nr:hypothetical protein [Deltaproteobacteria bacterium]
MINYIPSQLPSIPFANNVGSVFQGGTNLTQGFPISNSTPSYSPQIAPYAESVQSPQAYQSGVLACLTQAISQLVNLVSALVERLIGNGASPVASSPGSNVYGEGAACQDAAYVRPATGTGNFLDQVGKIWDFGKNAFSMIGKTFSGLWGGVKSFVTGLF